MDALTSHCVNLNLAGRRHGGGAGAALRCRDGVLLRPEFRFASRPLKVADSGLLRLSSSKLRRPICFASSISNAEADLETSENLAERTVPSKTAHVRFLLKKECLFGEEFLLVGDHPLLGSWDPSSAIPMNWSEGNVWILDIDIPIGRKIQFKFILRDVSTEGENIEWQPDPDRTIEIWETSNAITICEDWEYAIRQKIIEAETFIDFVEEVTDDVAETLVEEENLFADSVANTANGSALDTTFTEVPYYPEVVTNPNLAIVADNISSNPIEKLQFESDVSATQNIVEDNLVSSEGHVLVPGLSQFPMASTEDQEGSFHVEEEGTLQFEQEESSTVDELENIVADPKEVELDDISRKGAAAIVMVDYEEQQQINGRTQVGLQEEMSSKEVKHRGAAEVNVVVKSDIKWGHKALHGFLSNLGLLLQ